MISFIVVAYNSERNIRACLNHLLLVNGLRHEIIVMDNNSADNTRRIIKDEFPAIRLIESEENRGFSHGVNEAAKRARGDLIFLVNPDTEMVTHELNGFLGMFPTNNVGVMGPKVINPRDYSRQFSARSFPTLKAAVFNRDSILTKLIPNNRFSKGYLNPLIDEDRLQTVDWVSGCAMIIRKDVFDLVGGFDEKFFVFYEDVDFCYRVKRAGYQVIYNPEIVVSHRIGISKTVPTAKINYERHRGMWIYYTKHFRRNGFLSVMVVLGIVLRFAMSSPRVLLKWIKDLIVKSG
jgi:hypothetical protein